MADPIDTTGDDAVDASIAHLANLDLELPAEQLLGELSQVHDKLADRLRAVDG